MKIHILLLTVLAVFAFAFAGCDKAGAKIDTAGLEKSFSAAEAALKDASGKAVDAVKKGDYSGALKELQSLAANVKLTDDQKKAINDVIEQVKKAVTDAGGKAMGEAQKALGQ